MAGIAARLTAQLKGGTSRSGVPLTPVYGPALCKSLTRGLRGCESTVNEKLLKNDATESTSSKERMSIVRIDSRHSYLRLAGVGSCEKNKKSRMKMQKLKTKNP